MPRTRVPSKAPKKIPKPASPNGTHAEKKPPVDLAALFRKSTAVLKVPDFRSDDLPDTGIRIEVSSFKSEEARQVLQEYHDKLKQAEYDDAKAAVLSDGVVAQLVTLTKRWWHEGETTDGIYYNGQLLGCTPENKRMIYTADGWRWLRDFVVVGFMEESNFFGEPPKTA